MLLSSRATSIRVHDVKAYRQAIPAIELSIERCTSQVPDDGYYYVLLRGEVKARHRLLRVALAQYKAVLQESGWRPEPPERQDVDSAPEVVERYMDELEDYWNSSHRHSRRGGKAMYRK